MIENYSRRHYTFGVSDEWSSKGSGLSSVANGIKINKLVTGTKEVSSRAITSMLFLSNSLKMTGYTDAT